MSKAIIIEGSRNVGKTHLLKSLDLPNNTYKFPFASYFNDCFKNDFEGDWTTVNGRPELSYFSLASDIAVLDFIKQGHITHDILLDRNFLSTLVFGILTTRITYEQALNQLQWIMNNYGDIINIICIRSNSSDKDSRDKDSWEVYNKEETDRLYNTLLYECDKCNHASFFANDYSTQAMSEDSLIKFKQKIMSLMTDLPR